MEKVFQLRFALAPALTFFPFTMSMSLSLEFVTSHAKHDFISTAYSSYIYIHLLKKNGREKRKENLEIIATKTC